jgi:glucose uptake protein GlcU
MVTAEVRRKNRNATIGMTIGGAVAALIFGIIVTVVTGELSFLLFVFVGAATGWSIAAFASIEIGAEADGGESHAH